MIHLNVTQAKLAYGAGLLPDGPGAPILRQTFGRPVWVPCVRMHFDTLAGRHTKTYHPAIKD